MFNWYGGSTFPLDLYNFIKGPIVEAMRFIGEPKF